MKYCSEKSIICIFFSPIIFIFKRIISISIIFNRIIHILQIIFLNVNQNPTVHCQYLHINRITTGRNSFRNWSISGDRSTVELRCSSPISFHQITSKSRGRLPLSACYRVKQTRSGRRVDSVPPKSLVFEIFRRLESGNSRRGQLRGRGTAKREKIADR